MFSYVDKNIRQRLENDSRLVHLDREGRPVEAGSEENPFISLLGPIPLPRVIRGREIVLSWYPFVRRVELTGVLDAGRRVEQDDGGPEAFRALLQANMSVNSLLALPGFLDAGAPLVRVHSCCLTGDVFGSLRCECGPQLGEAFERISEEEGGAVVYMSGHEGRGIGLWAKAITYLLQDDGQDTYQANVSLGLPEDSRDFSDAAVVLRYLLDGRAIRLLSNNPLKREHLEQGGQPVAEVVHHVAGVGSHNRRYMRSKRQKGHLLPEDL
jgi:GTP cyclohydrolase II